MPKPLIISNKTILKSILVAVNPAERYILIY